MLRQLPETVATRIAGSPQAAQRNPLTSPGFTPNLRYDMLRFDGARTATEWNSGKVDPILRDLAEESADFMFARFAIDLTVTSIYRTPAEDKALYHNPKHTPGVHTAWRGIDLSLRNLSSHEAVALREYLNNKYAYDPNRPQFSVALLERGIDPDVDLRPDHLHIQVHPNLIARSIQVPSEAIA